MTSIGVSTFRHDNPKEAYIPSFSYGVPAGRRVQLVSVKEGIFHPRLPTIRKLDRDRTLHKLPDEHCRTSVSLDFVPGFKDFKKAQSVNPASLKSRNEYLTGDGRDIRYQYSPDELKKTRDDWSNFLNRSPERFQIKLTEHPDTANTPGTGYAMRYLKPDVTATWRFTLQNEPCLDKYGQRPVPADILNKYRDIYSRTAASVSTAPYRPPYKNHKYHLSTYPLD